MKLGGWGSHDVDVAEHPTRFQQSECLAVQLAFAPVLKVVNRKHGDYDVKLTKRLWEWMYEIVLNQPHGVVIRETACRRFQ